ncbi:MAG: LysR family transcriptional regulator, partial [Oscillospiraceae bacterium]
MNAKLELFKIYKTVCDNQNITKAAQELFVSQSAVSQAIKQLEQQAGVTLLNRNKQGVTMTAEGKVLFSYVSSAVNLLQTAQNKLEDMKTLAMGTLKIAASDTISQYLLLKKLEQYSKQYPAIKLQIVNRTSKESIELLKLGKVDIAFVNMPIFDDEITVTKYFKIHDIFVVPKGSEYLKKTYTLEEISKLPLILLEEKSNSRFCVQEHFLNNGITIRPEIELGSHELLLLFAKINLGVSCVIKEFSTQYFDSLSPLKIEKSQELPARYIGIAYLKGVSL